VKFSQQLNAFTVSAQKEYDTRGKVLGHEQEDVLELCLMLLADGLCSMPGAVVTIHPNGLAQLMERLNSSGGFKWSQLHHQSGKCLTWNNGLPMRILLNFSLSGFFATFPT